MTLFQEARSQGVKQIDGKTAFSHFLVIFRHFDSKSTKKTQNQAKKKKTLFHYNPLRPSGPFSGHSGSRYVSGSRASMFFQMCLKLVSGGEQHVGLSISAIKKVIG